MTSYLIESAICLALMLLIYQLLLSKTSLHQLKRFYLLACIIVPLCVPLVELEVFYGEAEVISSMVTPENKSDAPFQNLRGMNETSDLLLPSTSTQETQGPIYDWSFWAILGYSLVAGFLLFRYILSIYRIWQLARKSDREYHKGFSIILLTASTSPYSFFHLIFMGREDYSDDAIRERLLQHELTHARQWHSIDILSIQLIRVVFWFNPMYLLLDKAIRLNHEYIADASVLRQFGNNGSYQKLLLNFVSRPVDYSPLVSPSNYSFIKNRLSMMSNSTPQRAATMKVLMLIPAIAGVMASFTVKLKPTPPVFEEVHPQVTTVPASAPVGFPIDSVYYSVGDGEYSIPEGRKLDDYFPGIDITARPGRTVIATADGIVTEAGKDPKYGNYVLIEHNDTYKTLYASLSKVMVEEGTSIKLGQLLGTIGLSMPTRSLPGMVNRVHYAISENSIWVDPYKYFKKLPAKPANITVTTVPWAYPRALDITNKKSNRPDIFPFEIESEEYMALSGMTTGKTSINSYHDKLPGTEFICLPQTIVIAAAAGKVTEVVRNHGSYGNYVKIKHDDLHETMYAKLDEVRVDVGQEVLKGSDIARVGSDNETFGRFHYKVFRNGKATFPDAYIPGSVAKGPRPGLIAMNGQPGFFNFDFPPGFEFKSIRFNNEKAEFTKSSGEVISKKASELSLNQRRALLSFPSAPFRAGNKRPVPEEVYSRWHNPKVYHISIDGKEVANSEMAKYKPTDFAHSSWVVVGKDTKELKGYAFELWLQTPAYYQERLDKYRQDEQEWRKQTKALMSTFKGI